ncbi:TauD/TfdA family dioxygenase [Actinoplanes sp. NPDC049548]|uniref:TauD/TfdA family dioxygenase n=1 Tax=Actinoplanes sp. NPDC049548 TaxID=3155152 RepID=UPI00341A7BDB
MTEWESRPGRPAMAHLSRPVPPGHLAGWGAEHRSWLADGLARYGAVLVRGLDLPDAAALEQVARAVAGPPMAEREGFARRHPLGGAVLSSLDWPPDQPMCMHHEMSATRCYPRLLAVACFAAPEEGGVTGVADGQAVLAALPQDLRQRFAGSGWILDRCFHRLVGLPWEQAFGTADRAETERYAEANDIELTWDGDLLRTRQRRAAVVRHPATGAEVWFNQVAFLNEWSMDRNVREYLVMQFGPAGLPFNTRYGDGGAIGADEIDAINDTYERHTLREPWRKGDLMLIDNIRMAHSREPYRGRREIGLVFGDPVPSPDCPPAAGADLAAGSGAGRD